jgi:hypothetical protein
MIKWIMNMLACETGEMQNFIVHRLQQLTTPELMRIDSVATQSTPAEALQYELLNESNMGLILSACSIALKHDIHHSVSSIKNVMHALATQSLPLDNITVHLDARSAYCRIKGTSGPAEYADNLPMVALVEQQPNRMGELMKFMIERCSRDAELAGDYLSGSPSLSEGTL